MTILPPSTAKPARSYGPILLFGLVYLATLAIIFAPEGSLSTPATTDIMASSR